MSQIFRFAVASLGLLFRGANREIITDRGRLLYFFCFGSEEFVGEEFEVASVEVVLDGRGQALADVGDHAVGIVYRGGSALK